MLEQYRLKETSTLLKPHLTLETKVQDISNIHHLPIVLVTISFVTQQTVYTYFRYDKKKRLLKD